MLGWRASIAYVVSSLGSFWLCPPNFLFPLRLAVFLALKEVAGARIFGFIPIKNCWTVGTVVDRLAVLIYHVSFHPGFLAGTLEIGQHIFGRTQYALAVSRLEARKRVFLVKTSKVFVELPIAIVYNIRKF